jgi:hypothetical protein
MIPQPTPLLTSASLPDFDSLLAAADRMRCHADNRLPITCGDLHRFSCSGLVPPFFVTMPSIGRLNGCSGAPIGRFKGYSALVANKRVSVNEHLPFFAF